MTNKRQHGQYFTKGNPFIYKPFKDWLKYATTHSNNTILLEPFAGSNSIPLLIKQALKKKYTWNSYDIDPESNEKNLTSTPIEIRDVIMDFPLNYNIAITNPPYLAKNSATRRGIEYPYTDIGYDDLYKVALKVMLDNVDYVAAIIPESFIVQNLFHDRLKAVISLKGKMFEETECPVCLALFTKDKQKDFKIYSNEELIGYYKDLKKHNELENSIETPMKFNHPEGEISIIAIDNHVEESIRFFEGDKINSSRIKPTSRSITRIKLESCFTKQQIKDIIDISNQILKEKRNKTSDVFMTAFKGMRKDGKYRRRLDFNQIRSIINSAIYYIKNQ